MPEDLPFYKLYPLLLGNMTNGTVIENEVVQSRAIVFRRDAKECSMLVTRGVASWHEKRLGGGCVSLSSRLYPSSERSHEIE